MKKIAIIGTVGLPANYGGFETLAHHLVKNLNTKFEFTVYCTTKKYKKAERLKSYLGAKLIYLPFNANGIQSIFYDTVSIIHALFFADVLLVLGVAGCWILPFVRLFTNKKIIVSIDGIEWKRDKWGMLAKMYLWWVEKIAVKYSHIDISDNESIQDYTALRYKSLSRVIEYGGNHTSHVEATVNDYEKYSFLKYNYAVTVCRIEPENNIHIILEAYSNMHNKLLVFVGNWNNSNYGKNLRLKYSTFTNIILLDPIYEQREIDLLRSNASLYIHGHSAGGTNPSLVEAMCIGLPVVSFGVSYNKTTTEDKAFYFKSETELIEIIESTSFEKFRNNALLMKDIAKRRYQWENIASRYEYLIIEALATNAKSSITVSYPTYIDERLISNLQIGHIKNQLLFFEK